MTSSQAKNEFQIRYYWWAKSEFELEIERSLETFRSPKTVSVPATLEFMEKLGKTDRLLLAHALLKRFHSDAVRTLNESCLAEEKAVRDRFDFFRQDFRLSTAPGCKQQGEKLKPVSKRKLLKITAETFRNAFPESLESDRDEEHDPRLQFEMRRGGWVIYTSFWFGRREPLIMYSHGIATERIFEHQGASGNLYDAPFPLAYMISFCSWLGLRSQTEWEHLFAEDVPVVCDELIKHCGKFFDVAPKLLQGLEIDRIGDL